MKKYLKTIACITYLLAISTAAFCFSTLPLLLYLKTILTIVINNKTQPLTKQQ